MLRFVLAVLLGSVLAGNIQANDGNLDPNFNGGSVNLVQYANLNLSQSYLAATSKRVLVRPDQRLLIVGYGTTPQNVSPVRSLITTVALNANGSLDTSYFGTGRRNIEITDGLAVPVAVIDAAFQTDGGVVILSQRIATNTAYMIRLLSNGVADSNFGSGGIRRIDNLDARALVVGPGNEIYVLGGTLSTTMDGVAMAYTDMGQLRTGWGFGGSAFVGLDQPKVLSNDWVNDGFVQANGLLHLVGQGELSKTQTRAFRIDLTTAGTGQEGTFLAFDFGACASTGASATRMISSVRYGAGSLDLTDFNQDLSDCGPSEVGRYLTLERTENDISVVVGFLTPSENERINDMVLDVSEEYVYLVSQVFPAGLNDAFARVVRYRMRTTNAQLVPDPSFGSNGFADFFADTSVTQSAGTAIGAQADGRLVVAGGISSDVLGNAANHNTLVFRVDRESLFRNSFE